MEADTSAWESGRFVKVKCQDCSNEQIIFNKAATMVTCQVCGATLSTPSGGKAQIKGEIVGVLQ